jgi:outer membrane protein assembly factor BamB
MMHEMTEAGNNTQRPTAISQTQNPTQDFESFCVNDFEHLVFVHMNAMISPRFTKIILSFLLIPLLANSVTYANILISIQKAGADVSDWGSNSRSFTLSDEWPGGIKLSGGPIAVYRFLLPPPKLVSGQGELQQLTIWVRGRGAAGLAASAKLTIGGQNQGSLPVDFTETVRQYRGDTARSLVRSLGLDQPHALDVTIDASGILSRYEIKEVLIEYLYSGVDRKLLNAYQLAASAAESLAAFNNTVGLQWGRPGDQTDKIRQGIMQTVSFAKSLPALDNPNLIDALKAYHNSRTELFKLIDLAGSVVTEIVFWNTYLEELTLSPAQVSGAVGAASASLRELGVAWLSALNAGQVDSQNSSLINSKIDEGIKSIKYLQDLMNRDVGRIVSNKGRGNDKLAEISIKSLSPLVRYEWPSGAVQPDSYLPNLIKALEAARPFSVTPPPIPPVLQASKGTQSGYVGLTWVSQDPADGFELFRSERNDASSARFLGSLSGNASSYDDDGVNPKVTYFYWIRAWRNVNGSPVFSALSISDSGFTNEGPTGPKPAAPSGVQASDRAYTDRVRIIWDPVAGVDGYDAYRALEDRDEIATQIPTESCGTTCAEDKGARPGVTYFYWVRSWIVRNGQKILSDLSGSNQGIVQPVEPLRIIEQPRSQNVLEGDGPFFQVGVSSASPVSYQWYFNGAPLIDGGGISGSQSERLILSKVTQAQAGDYYAVVNSVRSSTAMLTVQKDRLRWAAAVSGLILSAPAISLEGTIYVGSDDGNLYAIDKGGKKKWQFPTGARIEGSPAINAFGTVHVGSVDQKIYAINADGSKKWELLLNGAISSTPAIAGDGTVFVGDQNGNFYAITPGGQKKWEFRGRGDILSSPAVGADGSVYFGTGAGHMYALRSSDGMRLWEFPAQGRVGEIRSSPAISVDGTIYFGSFDTKVYALTKDGSKKWDFPTAGEVWSSPVIGNDGTIYVGSQDSKLYAIDVNGSKRWEFFSIDETFKFAAADGADGTVCVVGSLFLNILDASGKRLWFYDPRRKGSEPTGSPAIAEDGTIYFGGRGNLYAVKGDTALSKSHWPMFHQNPRLTGSVVNEPSIPRFTLEVTPKGTVRVAPESGGDGKYASNAEVVLTPEPPPGSEFVSWSGDATGTTNPLTIRMDRDKRIQVNLGPKRYALSITVNPPGSGLAGPEGRYAAGTEVTLTNAPAAGYGFSSWGRDTFSTNKTTRVIMDTNKTIIANFALKPIIDFQLESRLVPKGSNVLFCVAAHGAGPLSFQWLFQGIPIRGANGSCLVLNSVTEANIGGYSVIVNNSAGSLTSSVVQLKLDTDTNSTSFVVRQLPRFYSPGVAFTVSLQATPPTGTVAYGVEEQLPSGWTSVSGVNENGEFDQLNRKVKWTFIDGQTRLLSYQVTPPVNTSGVQTFAGETNVNGTDRSAIGGSNQTDSAAIHPADANQDWLLKLSEVIAYATAYKRGSAWPVDPNPIPLGFVVRGLVLYKAGEKYRFDGSVGSAPGWWINDATRPLSLDSVKDTVVRKSSAKAGVSPGTAVRQLPPQYTPGVAFNVAIQVTPAAGGFAYGVEEQPPLGWAVSAINESGEFDSANKKVKWTFLDNATRTLTYQLTPPGTVTGTATFAGTVNFDGTKEVPVTGQTQLVGSIINIPPVITVHPKSQTANAGESVSFTVVATGTGLSYQWYFNRSAFPGATNSTLTLNNVQSAQAGDYSVMVRGFGEITSQVARLTVATVPAFPPSVISWWPGEGDATDRVGGNNGRLFGGITFTTGKVGQALSFDGTGYITIPDRANQRPNEITIEGWFYVTGSLSEGQEFVFASKYLQYAGWILRMGRPGTGAPSDFQPGFSIHREPNLGITAVSSAEIVRSKWVHLAGTYDGTDANIYVDGVLRGTRAFPGGYTGTTTPMTIATASWAVGGGNFRGLTDEIAIYGRALSAREVQDIFILGSQGKSRLSVANAGPRFDVGRSRLSPTKGFRLNVITDSTATVRIEVSNNLSDWQPMVTFPTASGFVEFIDPSATNFAWRFYRAVVP